MNRKFETVDDLRNEIGRLEAGAQSADAIHSTLLTLTENFKHALRALNMQPGFAAPTDLLADTARLVATGVEFLDDATVLLEKCQSTTAWNRQMIETCKDLIKDLERRSERNKSR